MLERAGFSFKLISPELFQTFSQYLMITYKLKLFKESKINSVLCILDFTKNNSVLKFCLIDKIKFLNKFYLIFWINLISRWTDRLQRIFKLE